MVSFGHTAVGSLVGLAAYHYFGDQNTTLGLTTTATAGIISHYLTDLIPHGHFFRHQQFKRKVIYVIIYDLFVSIILFLFVSYSQFGLRKPFFYILVGIGSSQLPDVLDGLIYSGLISPKGVIKVENDFHKLVHWHGSLEKSLLWGKRDIWQIMVALFCFGALLLW